jgi:disulfide oxidoreductase YuzD
VTKAEPSEESDAVLAAIRDRRLVYPVTVIDGAPVYDGAVSYPAILRAIQQRVEPEDPGA